MYSTMGTLPRWAARWRGEQPFASTGIVVFWVVCWMLRLWYLEKVEGEVLLDQAR